VNSTISCFAAGAIIILVVPGQVTPFTDVYGPVTVSSCARACSAGDVGWLVRLSSEHRSFLLKLFLAALLLRILIGTAIFVFNAQEFFGGDAMTYDAFGFAQWLAWNGDKYQANLVTQFVGKGEASGWGMVYFVAAVYGLVGRNMLAIQLVNAVIGAVSAVIIFLCAHDVFANVKVARLAAFAVAFYPSLVAC
jgi:hypothetical protein